MAGMNGARRNSRLQARVLESWPFVALSLALGLTSSGCQGAISADQPDAQQAFTAANALYAQGSYAEAADAFSWLEKQGYRNADLSFNQGLAQAAAGPERLGLAILAHERALRIRPRDQEIRGSLDELRNQSGATSQASSDFWARVERSRTWIADGELWLLAGIFWNLAAILLFWRQRQARMPAHENRDHRLRPMTRAVLIVMLLPLVVLALRGWQQDHQPAAVVTAAQSTLLSVPGPPAPNAPERPLAPGTLVRIQGEREGYFRVLLSEASGEGWLLSSEVELIETR